MKLSELLSDTSLTEAKVKVMGIKWDADNPKDIRKLPKNVTLKIPSKVDIEDEEEVGDFIEDELSNKYGFTHNGWRSEKIIK